MSEPTLYSVNSLSLNDFRNYENLSLRFKPGLIVITSPNGSGKTNILEAISMLAPGRGLRSAKLKEMDNQATNRNWQINANINGAWGVSEIMTSRAKQDLGRIDKRNMLIDGNSCKTQTEIAEILSIMWLTPMMDQIFNGPSADRRKFLDRLVYNFDPNHAQLLNNYETNIRERLKLIREYKFDEDWVNVIERNLASLSASIAASRNQTIEYLQQAIEFNSTKFPKGKLSIIGEVEELISKYPALEVEEILKKKYKEQRRNDAESGRTNLGIHRSDLQVFHLNKKMNAGFCSTGEQKALLITIILAEARARIRWRDSIPILLLDEIVAHLDIERKDQLIEELQSIGGQCFLTGTDLEIFNDIKNTAQFLSISNQRVTDSNLELCDIL